MAPCIVQPHDEVDMRFSVKALLFIYFAYHKFWVDSSKQYMYVSVNLK